MVIAGSRSSIHASASSAHVGRPELFAYMRLFHEPLLHDKRRCSIHWCSMGDLRWPMLYKASLSIITVTSACSSDKCTHKTVLYGPTNHVAECENVRAVFSRWECAWTPVAAGADALWLQERHELGVHAGCSLLELVKGSARQAYNSSLAQDSSWPALVDGLHHGSWCRVNSGELEVHNDERQGCVTCGEMSFANGHAQCTSPALERHS